ncbi:MAG: succinate dehydrogenase/fumarate reductase iron-sulfur subunit [Candidatus Eremiobacteraeota bacterium]|nr:succinate dehydrogenase/fumarate reductase iron-sulfur subunit [Candidatus Eremiobacteraeota bacterium]
MRAQARTGRTFTLRINRGEHGDSAGRWESYDVELAAGMVVLDAVLFVQAKHAPDLAVRWNCKAAKCGSCAAEVNGRPRLLCKTRLEDFNLAEPVLVQPMQTFVRIKDLVTDVSWNYRVNEKIIPFRARTDRPWKFYQRDVEKAQEMRQCIECFLCQDVCHVLRYSGEEKPAFFGPRFFVRAAGLDFHPMDAEDRVGQLRGEGGIGLCNITKCCTEVCPANIHITDDAIIPEKERAVDAFDDPFRGIFRRNGAPKP